VLAVRDAVRTAVERARAGGGPSLIEAMTYRHYGHSRTDPAKYRPDEEVRSWLERDPLILARAHLRRLDVPDEVADQADEEAAKIVSDAIAAAKAAPDADPGEAFTDVWADGSAAWRT
jgi:acetoin:2,6-dichlorophenolindophenol oxidoreductase subunit alpha